MPSRTRRRRRAGRIGQVHPLVALLWLAPALALILGVVLYPAIKLFDASRGEYSITGLRKGDAGWDNYVNVLQHPDLGTVLRNTVVWVVAVVAITIVLSLALAQFLVKSFPGDGSSAGPSSSRGRPRSSSRASSSSCSTTTTTGSSTTSC